MPRGAPDWGFLAPQKPFMQLCREQNHFFENADLAGQGAGVYSELQLWNPDNSGVDAFINMLSFETEAASDVVCYWYTAARANLKAYGVNRYAGGTASKINTRWEGRAVGTYSNEIYRIASTTTRQEITHLNLWLPPSWGLSILNLTTNNSIEVGFTWYEFPSTEV